MANDKKYFDCSESNPLQSGKLNIEFFQHLIKEIGFGPTNKSLWPAENLSTFINEMKNQQASLASNTDREMAAKLIRQYKALYKTLIGQ